ncbi:hypothetical protein [Pseudoalteromonas luteoviolacea]|uniref:hypothetical protein n=1 Tax=Pseudoalteromonas luteoviolacea TaxID=43657 RepID=UPI001B380F5B|nr:hypothetical protein [Pseudoalteromonas luteoviolacea]MBQ4836038.1 hypothetical protein [Pseudoalteromonas luteoviolacea]
MILDNIEYPQFVWKNEFQASGIVQQTEFALNGSSHVEKSQVIAGRSVVLESELEDITSFETLFNHSQSTLIEFQITIRGVTFNVIWDHSEAPISAEPHRLFSDAKPDFFRNVVLRFRTV